MPLKMESEKLIGELNKKGKKKLKKDTRKE